MTGVGAEERARALFLEALEHLAREEYAAAEARLHEANRLVPRRVSVLTNLSAALLRQHKIADAANCAEQSVALDPGNPQGWLNLTGCRFAAGALAEALDCCERCLALKSDHAEAWSSRGAILLSLFRYEEALASCDKAIALQPGLAGAWSNRGLALKALQQPEAAIASCGQATALEPRSFEAWFNLATTYTTLRRHGEALECYEKAVALKPSPYMAGDLLWARMQVCSWEGFEAACERTLAGVDAGERAAVPFSLLAIDSSPAQQRRCAERHVRELYGASFAPPPAPRSHARIRLGYFSGDFYDHATSQLMAGLFELHDRSRFELFAFSFDRQIMDATRRRVAAAFEHFFDVSTKNDAEVARLARQHEIDIAVDLKGLTAEARTGIFAHRAASLQVNYLGYPGTMGADCIDYLIADRIVVPPQDREHYSECVAWLPHSYQANDSRRPIAPHPWSRAQAGLPERGFVFCCFNNPFKITPDAFDTWMRLLQKVEGSVLWLLDHNPAATRNLRAEAQSRGIRPGRLVFAPPIDFSAHLARHRLADLFVDTFYCNAHTTAADALWAGLPFLTCPGRSFAGRVGASLLNAVGLPELIADSRQEYESLALALAADPERLGAIRRKLARNIPTQPLFDTALFARHLEAAYTAMHERALRGLPPEDFEVAA